MALFTTAAGCAVGSTAHAAPPPDIPPEYLTASETEIPGEAEFWLERIPCPELAGLTARENLSAYASGDRVTVTCGYDDNSTDKDDNPTNGWVGNISIDWEKPGTDDHPLFCGQTTGDVGYELTIADPSVSAMARAQFDGRPDLVQLGKPHIEAWFDEFALPLGLPCENTDLPECPPIDGWVRMGFFGPQDIVDTTPGPGFETRSIEYECGYTEPNASSQDAREMSFDMLVYLPHEDNSPEQIQRSCSFGDRFAYGTGLAGTGGAYPIETTYSVNSPDPYDLSPFLVAIDQLVDVVSARAETCDGVELLPNDPFTPLPAWLEDVFTSEATTSGLVPTIAELQSGSVAPAEPTPDTEQPADAVDTEVEPAPPDTSTAPADAGDADDTDADSRAAATPPRPGPSGPSAGTSTLGLLMKVVSIGAIVLSLLMLVVTFLFIRRESRVRPKWDIVRIVFTAIVATVMIVVFAASAPTWAIAAAVVAGGVLGIWQGRNLVVRMTERGVFAKRSSWAIAAFTVGIVVTQIAGLLNRTNVFRVGIALTFFSGAMSIGLFIGRQPKIRTVRAAAAAGVSLVFLGPLFALTPAHDTTASAPEPVLEELSPRPEITQQLIEMADWTKATIDGGLWTDTGKPLLEISLAPGLTEPPEPITRTVAWDSRFNDTDSFNLTETYTFLLRADGVCCSIDYLAAGERIRGDTVEPIDFDARLADIQLYSTEGPGIERGEGWLPGLPFAEQRYVQLDADQTATDCHRPVAETRSFETLEEFGGDVEVRKGFDGGVRPGLDVVIGVPCDVPGFTLDAALDLAPTPPPPNDPSRVHGQLGNCPVLSEVIKAFSANSTFDGVDTATAGSVMFDGNSTGCYFGGLFDAPSVGEGGPGNTRHRFAMDLAQPRAGEWSRGYDRWFPDECCISPASVTEPPSDDICDVDDAGLPIAPPDLDDGGSCGLVTRHKLPQGEIYISTDYDLSDGPDTFIRAAMPWGAFFYNCHHCEVGDPEIEAFLDGIIQAGRGMAADVTYTVAAGDLVVAQDTVQTGTTPPTTPDGAPTTTVPTTEPGEITREEAEDLVDLTLGDDATDAEREAAIAVIIGLIGAGAIGATTLGEAGVGAREVADAWRSGGRQGVNDLIDERNRPTPVIEEAPDPNELVSAWDPTIDNGFDEHGRPITPGGWVRVTRAERDRLDALTRGEESDRWAGLHADERAARQAEIDEHGRRVREIDDEYERETRGQIRREQLEREREINQAEQDFWGNPVNQVISIFIDTSTGIGHDLVDTPEALLEVARRAGQATRDGLETAHEVLSDPETWTIAGETLAGTLRDAIGLAIGDDTAYDHLQQGSETIGRGVDLIAAAVWADPQGFLEQMAAIDKLRGAMDPDKPLADRLSDYGQFATEILIEWATGAAAVDAAADTMRAVDAIDDARDAARAAGAIDDARDAARAAEAADTARDAARAAEAADSARDAARAAEAADEARDAARAAGTIDESRSAARTAGTIDDSTDAARTADALDATTDATRGADGLTDVERAALPLDDAPPRLSDEVFDQRQQAWADLQEMASSNVDEFEDALDDLASARLSGNADEIAAAEERAREAMIRVQSDKRTLQEINLRDEATRSAYNDLINRELYEPIDRKVLDEMASRNGFGQMPDEPYMILDDGTRIYRDDAGNAIHLMSPTNPSGSIKVGADRDFTVRLQTYGEAARDVHHDELAQVYNGALWDQVGGDPGRYGLPRDLDADGLAARLDQAMTSEFHVESYTDLETILRHPDGSLRDPEQIRLAMQNKGEHWMQRFGDVPDERLAEDMMAEGMRQSSKQFGNQVTSRFDAMNGLRADAGLPPLEMPDRLQESYRILSQVNPKPPARPTLSPVEAERLLHQLGTSPSNFADEMGSFMQMVEQSRVQLPS